MDLVLDFFFIPFNLKWSLIYCNDFCRRPRIETLKIYWYCLGIIYTEWIIWTSCRYTTNFVMKWTRLNFLHIFRNNLLIYLQWIDRIMLIEMLILHYHVQLWVTGLFSFLFASVISSFKMYLIGWYIMIIKPKSLLLRK